MNCNNCSLICSSSYLYNLCVRSVFASSTKLNSATLNPCLEFLLRLSRYGSIEEHQVPVMAAVFKAS